MTAQVFLKGALRDALGPTARDHGYNGSAPTWRRANAAGDWAVVNVQSSSSSTASSLRCVVNLAVAPEPWLRWQATWLRRTTPKSVGESLGLYRQRLHPQGTPPNVDGWWTVTVERSARATVDDMLHQLEADGWPVLGRLLEPGAMIQQLRSGSLGDMKRTSFGVFFARAEALLLMDNGPTAELDSVLQVALADCMPAQRENAETFDRWVRGQATAARSRV